MANNMNSSRLLAKKWQDEETLKHHLRILETKTQIKKTITKRDHTIDNFPHIIH